MSDPTAIPDGTGLFPGFIVGNKYRIDGCLGEGGMGVVLSATHLELDAPVAIKVVREEYAGSDDIVERVLFEARAVARMRSSHVVRVLDVARLDSGCPYIVMEQLQGVDLGNALWDNGPFSVPEAIDFLLQACDGLAEAHGLGIVHRDLKPGNLFLATTPEGVVLKVLDFGISKEVGSPLRSIARRPRTSLTSSGDPVGSPYYMAPEQMRASPDIDARADIWSLGAILFELLTAQCPFEGDTMSEVCAKVLTEDPTPLSTLSSGPAMELEPVIARCLAKDPKLRYQTVGEFAQALRAWRPSEDVELPEPEPRSRLRRSARLPLAMVGLSAALALGAVGFWQTRGSAASVDARKVRPMIAAEADPIWRALPTTPKVEPAAPTVMHARLQEKPSVKPSVTINAFQPATMNAFQPATVKAAPPTQPEIVPAHLATVNAVLPDANAATTEAAPPPDELPASVVDPVSGRYGL